MIFQRELQISDIIEKKSVFLLGPRQTGKSTLLAQQLAHCPKWNLLESGTFRRLSADPGALRREASAMALEKKHFIIDEIQLLPELLNEVHLMIEEDRFKFVLTGSSARGLKRRGVNLLAGRAWVRSLHPLTSREIGIERLDLSRAFHHGLLPFVYLSENPQEELESYVGTYLKNEISAEGLTRNLPMFSRFLETAAHCNGTLINFTTLASDAQVKRTTLIDWFDVLKDTLLIHELPPWRDSKKRKAIQTAKYYLFDLGIARVLKGLAKVEEKSKDYGDAFEHFLFLELKAAESLGRIQKLSHWRSTSGFEVDFVFEKEGKTYAVEAKAKTRVDASELKGLKALREEGVENLILVSLQPQREIRENVDLMPWQHFCFEFLSGASNS